MNEVLKLINNRLEELIREETEMRKEQMQLQNRTSGNAEHLATIAKLRSQFEDAKQKLES